MLRFFRSSIGLKAVMGVSGALLVGFVIAHLLGNLTVFGGPDAVNAYSKKLHDLGPLLWVARLGLIGLAIAHIVASVQLTEKNRAARPVPYAAQATVQATWTSRTMLASGMLVLAYLVYHLAHFTFRVTNPEISHMADAHGHHDVYSMVVLSFRQPLITISYTIAMLLLGMHLNHGVSSFFQTLGLNTPRYAPLIRKLGPALALLIVAGYISIPVAILFGWVRPTQAGL